MSAPDYTCNLTMPYVDGVYVAVNAIPDALLVVDSPSCAAYKAERLHINHDWLSTFSTPTRQRLFQSNLTIPELSMGVDTGLRHAFERACEAPDKALIFLTSISVVTVTGKQYVHILDEYEARAGAPIIELPSRDLYADWLEGYSDTLSALARNIPLPSAPGRADPRDVALIGYFHDRDEADHRANIHELERLLRHIGLNPLCTWLSGAPVSALQKVAQAGTLLALPYGRKAARLLAKRTGAAVIDLPLPLGPLKTAHFLETLAQAYDCTDSTQAFIRDETTGLLNDIRVPTARYLTGKQPAVFAEPFLLEGLSDCLAYVGAEPVALFCPARTVHGDEAYISRLPVAPVFMPTIAQVTETLRPLRESDGLDLCIGDSLFLSFAKQFDTPCVEMGFPSYFTHHLTPAPFLGYVGMRGFVERLANAIAQDDFRRFGR